MFTLGSHTVTCTAEDAAGNAASSTQFTVKVVDPSAPVVTPHVAGTEGDNGWYTSDVTVSWTVSDGESAITSTTGCDTTVVIKDTSGTTFTCSATSQGGTSSESVTIKRDTVAPSVSVVLDRAAAASGWFNSATGAPTAVVTCDDETSGLSSCSPDKTFGDGADQSYTATATDAAGNSASDAVSNVDVDTVAPSVSVVLDRAAAASGWFNSATGAPTAVVTCDDETSGLSSCSPDKTFGDGADQSYTATATDAAGNSASDAVSNVDVDTVAPSVSVVLDRAAAASGWFNSATGAPTAVVTCDDETSGLSSCSPDKTFGDGADQSFTATATDAAGNSASDSVSNVDVDTVAPSVSVVLDRAAAASGWFNSATGAPTADVTCDDETSGLSSCTPDKTFGDGADQSFTATATDAAGNNASDSVTNVDVDTVAPGITWNGGPLENGSYYFDYVPAAPTCTATDSLSGAGTCTVGGYGTAIGGHSMTATAHDLAGNTTTQTRAYSVAAWSNHGFYQPVDMGVLNLVKGGSTVPLKFEVFAGTELTSTSAVSSFKVGTVSCGGLTGTPTDDIEQYSTGGTTLRYDTTGGQFIQNWQVPKGAGICYKVVMTTRDGGSLTATFKTK